MSRHSSIVICPSEHLTSSRPSSCTSVRLHIHPASRPSSFTSIQLHIHIHPALRSHPSSFTSVQLHIHLASHPSSFMFIQLHIRVQHHVRPRSHPSQITSISDYVHLRSRSSSATSSIASIQRYICPAYPASAHLYSHLASCLSQHIHTASVQHKHI